MLVIDYLVLNIATVKFFHLCVSLISKYNNKKTKRVGILTCGWWLVIVNVGLDVRR